MDVTRAQAIVAAQMEEACRQGLLFQPAQGQFQQWVGDSELCVKSTELGRGANLRL